MFHGNCVDPPVARIKVFDLTVEMHDLSNSTNFPQLRTDRARNWQETML